MGLIIHVRGLTITSIVTRVQNNIHSPLLSSYYNKYFCTNIIQKYFVFYTFNYRVCVFLFHTANESFIIISTYTYDIWYSTCIILLLMQPTRYYF